MPKNNFFAKKKKVEDLFIYLFYCSQPAQHIICSSSQSHFLVVYHTRVITGIIVYWGPHVQRCDIMSIPILDTGFVTVVNKTFAVLWLLIHLCSDEKIAVDWCLLWVGLCFVNIILEPSLIVSQEKSKPHIMYECTKLLKGCDTFEV